MIKKGEWIPSQSSIPTQRYSFWLQITCDIQIAEFHVCVPLFAMEKSYNYAPEV